MSLLRNCRIESVEKAIYVIDTLNLKGNQTIGYPLNASESTGDSLVVEDSSDSLIVEKGGEKMVEWRPRKGLKRLELKHSESGEDYFEVTEDIDWNDPDLDWDDEDILMAYQEYVERFGEFDFDEDGEESSEYTEDEFDSDFYSEEDDEEDFDDDFYADEDDEEDYQDNNSDSSYDEDFDDDFYEDEDIEFDFDKVSQKNKPKIESQNNSNNTTDNSIDIEELKRKIRLEVTKELEEKYSKEIENYENRIEELKGLIVNKNEQIENYKAQLNSKINELNKMKTEVKVITQDNSSKQEIVELKEKLKDTTKELQDTSLENIKLKKQIKKLLEDKATRVESNKSDKPNYDNMQLKELALCVKKFMLRNGCKQKPVDKQLLVAEFGANNVNRLVVQRFLVQKNNGYIL